jgi:hypothetical protein
MTILLPVTGKERETRNSYKILVGKPEEKRPFGEPSRIQEANPTGQNPREKLTVAHLDKHLKEKAVRVWIGFSCLRIGSCGGIL